jgi:surface antigen
MMKRGRLIIVTVLALNLGGCMGLATKGAQQLFGDKEKPPADRIAAEQEAAISVVHGGSAGIPITWTDKTSGIQGALVAEASGEVPNGCRPYQQTVILAGETLQGRVVACSQTDGSWKLFKGSLQSHQ